MSAPARASAILRRSVSAATLWKWPTGSRSDRDRMSRKPSQLRLKPGISWWRCNHNRAGWAAWEGKAVEAGFLGVGNREFPRAGKLMAGGHSLPIHDISEAAMLPLLQQQARRAASPKDLSDQCEIVFVSLPTL